MENLNAELVKISSDGKGDLYRLDIYRNGELGMSIEQFIYSQGINGMQRVQFATTEKRLQRFIDAGVIEEIIPLDLFLAGHHIQRTIDRFHNDLNPQSATK